MPTLPILPLEFEPTRAGQFEHGYLHHWRDAAPGRPALVFAPGFLTEGENGFRDWRKPVTQLAELWDVAAYGLHWPSASVAKMLADQTTNPFLIGKFVAMGFASRLAAKVLLSPIFPGNAFIGTASIVTMAFSARDVWKTASAQADTIGEFGSEWPTQLGRPVILAGHSLGGRLALRAAERAPERRTFLAIHALAPAIQASAIDLHIVAQRTVGKPILYHSGHDKILELVFRLAETSWEHALGRSGVPGIYQGAFEARDVSTRGGVEIGHLDYQDFLMEFLGPGPVEIL